MACKHPTHSAFNLELASILYGFKILTDRRKNVLYPQKSGPPSLKDSVTWCFSFPFDLDKLWAFLLLLQETAPLYLQQKLNTCATTWVKKSKLNVRLCLATPSLRTQAYILTIPAIQPSDKKLIKIEIYLFAQEMSSFSYSCMEDHLINSNHPTPLSMSPQSNLRATSVDECCYTLLRAKASRCQEKLPKPSVW